jgi:hypothetical protein
MKKIVALSCGCCAVLFILAASVLAQTQAPAKIAGTWKMTNQGRGYIAMNTLTIKQDGNTFTGNKTPDNGATAGVPETMEDGTINGNAISFVISRKAANGDVEKIEYKGTVDGDTMSGKLVATTHTTDWTAKRSQ